MDWGMEVCSLASDCWGDLRQGTTFWGASSNFQVSSQGLKKDSPILECIYLSLFCVDLSIHLHLKTNSWAKHQCLSEHSIATQLFASCPMPSAPLVSSPQMVAAATPHRMTKRNLTPNTPNGMLCARCGSTKSCWKLEPEVTRKAYLSPQSMSDSAVNTATVIRGGERSCVSGGKHRQGEVSTGKVSPLKTYQVVKFTLALALFSPVIHLRAPVY